MAYTTTDLSAIRAAIASGVLTVHYENRTVTYRSLEELRALEASMARELETPRKRQAFGYATNGF